MSSSSEPGHADLRPPDGDENIASPIDDLAARQVDLDRFFRTASHDLRAPLRSIEAFTRIALETEDRAEAAEHLDRALNAVARMRTLLDSLLDYADSGGALEMSATALDDVVNAALEDLAADIERSGAIVDVGDLPSIECDPTQLRRVFTNVFSNSIRHSTSPGRNIAVRATEASHQIVVSISDDGDGFSAEFVEEAFVPFRRLSSTSGGQGIGLAICRRIVELHGGRIWATSEPGEGTTISFTLGAAPT